MFMIKSPPRLYGGAGSHMNLEFRNTLFYNINIKSFSCSMFVCCTHVVMSCSVSFLLISFVCVDHFAWRSTWFTTIFLGHLFNLYCNFLLGIFDYPVGLERKYWCSMLLSVMLGWCSSQIHIHQTDTTLVHNN